MTRPIVSLRINHQNADHHIWNNNGVWWLHLTLHLDNYTKRRVPRSLGTREVGVARTRRDWLLRKRDLSPLLLSTSANRYRI